MGEQELDPAAAKLLEPDELALYNASRKPRQLCATALRRMVDEVAAEQALSDNTVCAHVRRALLARVPRQTAQATGGGMHACVPAGMGGSGASAGPPVGSPGRTQLRIQIDAFVHPAPCCPTCAHPPAAAGARHARAHRRRVGGSRHVRRACGAGHPAGSHIALHWLHSGGRPTSLLKQANRAEGRRGGGNMGCAVGIHSGEGRLAHACTSVSMLCC